MLNKVIKSQKINISICKKHPQLGTSQTDNNEKDTYYYYQILSQNIWLHTSIDRQFEMQNTPLIRISFNIRHIKETIKNKILMFMYWG